MKKLALILISLVCACVSMNAQVANTSMDFQYRGGNFYRNGVKLAPEQLCATIGESSYYDVYQPAKRKRAAGIVCVSVGAAATVGGTVWLISAANRAQSNVNDDTGYKVAGNVMEIVGGAAVAGAGITSMIVGGVLCGSANRTLRNIRPASSGVGITMAF